MASLSLLSPAKLNLFLHITGQRADGYHTLQTLFQLLDYGDKMHFASNSSGKCVLDTPISNIPDDENLIIRAANALQQASQTTQGANISIDKTLPMGGGLGGGSSNAATTLIALNHLWQTGLSREALAAIGIGLGADVPVFVHAHTAWAEGVGEILTPITLAEQWFVVIKPDCHVCTATIFSHQQLTRDTDAITVAAFLDQGGRNDCEAIVSEHYPEVANALDWLRKHHSNAALTGTGACVFARFDNEVEAENLAANLPNDWEHFVAKGINQSPGFDDLSE